jgi:GNAT superfamily N-acetyltransferase
MAREELNRIAEIDVSESGDIRYKYGDGEIKATRKAWQRPQRSLAEWQHQVDDFVDAVEQGGVALGAFDGDLLVGLAVLRYKLTENMAQLAGLFVSKSHRRQGVAAQLTQEVIRLAQEDGARELYVSATPSESAVSFYKSQGFRLAEKVNRKLYALEPEDIHMTREL